MLTFWCLLWEYWPYVSSFQDCNTSHHQSKLCTQGGPLTHENLFFPTTANSLCHHQDSFFGDFRWNDLPRPLDVLCSQTLSLSNVCASDLCFAGLRVFSCGVSQFFAGFWSISTVFGRFVNVRRTDSIVNCSPASLFDNIQGVSEAFQNMKHWYLHGMQEWILKGLPQDTWTTFLTARMWVTMHVCICMRCCTAATKCSLMCRIAAHQQGCCRHLFWSSTIICLVPTRSTSVTSDSSITRQ